MAANFGTTGNFGTQQTQSPIDQLIATAKKKAGATQPANIYAAPAVGAAPATTITTEASPGIDNLVAVGTSPVAEAQTVTAAGGQEVASAKPYTVEEGGLKPAAGATLPQGLTVDREGFLVDNTGYIINEADYARYVAAGQSVEAAQNNGMPEPPAGITPEIHYISNDPNSPFYWQTLGYADASWAGLPYEMGWTQDGVWVQQRDLSGQAAQLHELQNIQMPTRPGMTDITTTTAMQGIQSLIDLWNDPNTPQADKDAAVASFEQEMGQQPGWFADQMSQMYGQQSGGVFGQQGMSQAQRQDYDRETQLELQGMQENYKQLLESMSAGGRDVAGYQKMDEIARSMSTFQGQKTLERWNMDNAMKQAEYDALRDRYGKLFEMQQISAGSYQQALSQNRLNALQGYAQELAAYVQQNQTTLDAYRADLEGVQIHAQTVYQGIMADIGVSSALMEEMQSRYEMYYAPYYAELERWSIEEQVRQQDEANRISAWSAIPIIGPIVAAASTSVICTELKRQGLMDEETHRLDSVFGMRLIIERPDIYLGYLRFATPIVRRMRQSRGFTLFINFFVKGWSREMLFRMDARSQGSILGKIIMGIGFRFCAMIGGMHGRFVGATEYR